MESIWHPQVSWSFYKHAPSHIPKWTNKGWQLQWPNSNVSSAHITRLQKNPTSYLQRYISSNQVSPQLGNRWPWCSQTDLMFAILWCLKSMTRADSEGALTAAHAGLKHDVLTHFGLRCKCWRERKSFPGSLAGILTQQLETTPKHWKRIN